MRTLLEEDRLHVAVDLLILSEREGTLRLMLAPRTAEPFRGQWALPGCFVGLNESLEEAAERLLAEMLPMERAYKEQLFTFSEVERDPRGRVISAAYLVIVPWQKLRQAEGMKMQPFTIAYDGESLCLTDEKGLILSGEELAFDHGRILKIGIDRIRGKIEYTDTGFHFLNNPQSFALGEVQRVFEAVLGKTLDGSNFRRYISKRYEEAGIITQTSMAEKGRRGRPAALYRWNGTGR